MLSAAAAGMAAFAAVGACLSMAMTADARMRAPYTFEMAAQWMNDVG
jgi:hypothetical protein